METFSFATVDFTRTYDSIAARADREYGLLQPHLKTINSVLDIGCGLACMDVLLARHHGTKHIHLLDGDGTGPKVGAYSRKETEPWNDVAQAQVFVKDNVADDVSVSVYYWGRHERPEHVDLVMSLWSWGFHYPVETYMPMLKHYPDALVMLDVRNIIKHVDGMRPLLKAGYETVAVVEQNNKARRVILRRK